ncbi:MAG TPA: hypothetical protein VLD37_05580 [Candidatus Bilamarchaeum sp.]|nr:hypothetical protein [Candidatus Bilamarchaeum sp.]
MRQRRRGSDSGTFPKITAGVLADRQPPSLSLDDILSVIGKEMSRYDSRKTFAVVMPKEMSRDEALDSLRKGLYEVRDKGREIELHIFSEKPVA